MKPEHLTPPAVAAEAAPGPNGMGPGSDCPPTALVPAASTAMQPVHVPADVPLWRNRPFLALWTAQAITQTAHNALWYALMVLVEQVSHSTTHLGVTILTVVIPSVLFGVVAGVFVDHWEKRTVLIVTNVLRAALMLGFLALTQLPVGDGGTGWLLTLFALSFVFSTITQFFAPAETALIPALVHPRRLLQANSGFHLTFLGSQLAGLVLIGPLIVKLFGMTIFFVLLALGFALSAALVWPLPRTRHEAFSPVEETQRVARRLQGDIAELWAFLRRDRASAWCMMHLTVGSTLALLVAMLAPGYVTSVLGISAEDVVFVLAPAGVGMIVAALSLQRVARWISKETLIHTGLGLLGVTLMLIGIVPLVWQLLPITRAGSEPQRVIEVGLPFLNGALGVVVRLYPPEQGSLLTAVGVLTLVAGLGFASVIVPAQTILQERAPAASRGRIFAVQLMLGSLASVIPLLGVGSLADLIGTPWVFVSLGLGLLLFLWLLLRRATVLGTLPRQAAPERPGP